MKYFFVGFQKVTSEPLEIFDFVDPQGRSSRSPHYTQNNIRNIKIEICKIQPSKRQEYFCLNCLCTFKQECLSAHVSLIWLCINHQIKINGKKRPHGRSPKIYTLFGRTLPNSSLGQGNYNYQRYNQCCLKFCAWFHTLDVFCLLQC